MNLDTISLLNVGSKIGSGSESTIYQKDNKAIKIFNTNKKEIIQNKIKKLEILSTIKDNSFALPKGLVSINGHIVGYYMDLIEYNEDLKDFFDFHFIEDKQQIKEYLIKADKAMQRVHKLDIAIGDIKHNNIMIDKNNNPIFIDTDNYSVKDYDFDKTNETFYYLNETFKNNFSKIDNDKYLYAMMAIQNFITGTQLWLYQSPEYYATLINLLNVDKEVKDGLKQIFSDSINKPYITPILEKIDVNQELLTKENREKIKLLHK